MKPRTFAAFVLAIATGSAAGQIPVLPVSSPFGVDLDSGARENLDTGPQTVWAEVVSVPQASSLQILFDVADLGSDEDRISVRSLLDNDVQSLDRFALRQWTNHTAWFNGSQVLVELRLAPGSQGRVAITTVHGGNPAPDLQIEGSAGPCTYCNGSDSRVATTDVRVCRLVGSGICTGWLIDDQSTILTAAHCYSNPSITPLITPPGALVTAQFNVPASTSTGALVNPPAADQFPVLLGTIQFSSLTPSIPDDWVVVKLGNNANAESASTHAGAWFHLANSLPAAGATLRVTGCGADNTPTCATNSTLQTATGPDTSGGGSTVSAMLQVQSGNSGGPLIDVGTGLGLAIADTCSTGTFCRVSGVSVTYSPLATAIATATGCPQLNLSDGPPQNSCGVTTLFNLSPAASRWNIMSLATTADWDLQVGTAGSVGGTGATEIVAANGHLGSISPTGGTAFRYSGTAGAALQMRSAQTLPVDSAVTSFWNGGDVARAFEFESTGSGTYHLTVLGDPSLSWRVLSPGSNAGWRPATSATSYSGSVNASPVPMSLLPGWHAVVVYKNGGTGAVPNTGLYVAVTTLGTLPLLPNAPVTLSTGARGLSCNPTASVWNVMGVSSASDWDVINNTERSVGSGNVAEFMIVNGHLGAIPATNTLAFRFNGTAGATAEHTAAGPWSMNDISARPLPAGEIFRVLEFNVGVAGSYDVSVAGDPSLAWRLYAPGGGSPAWRPRISSVLSGIAGGAGQTVTLAATGWHCLVVSSDGGPGAATRWFVPHVCPSAGGLALAVNAASTTVSNPCQAFSIVPFTDYWNAVGIFSTSDWDASIGGLASTYGGNTTDYLVADGNAGTISPSSGSFARFTGSATAQAQHVRGAGISLPSTAVSLAATGVLTILELDVPSAANYNLSVTGTSGFQWALFKSQPGGAAWRRRSDSFGGDRNVGSGAFVAEPLPAGYSSLVICRDGAAGAGAFTVNFGLTPNPLPVLGSVSPATILRDGPAASLTVDGSSFLANSTVRWAGTSLATTFVSASQLTAQVPASLLNSAGLFPVTVFTPAPGGGTSGAVSVTVANPAPSLASIVPATLTASTASAGITVSGSSFVPESTVRLDGTSLATGFSSAGVLSATVPAGAIVMPGTYSIDVFSPPPGGGASAMLPLTITYPVPAISSLAPASLIAGSATTSINVNGTGFFAASVVRLDGIPAPSSYVGPTQVQVAIPATLLLAGRTIDVAVFNPAPGGGASAGMPLPVLEPVLSSLSPATLAVQLPAAPAQPVSVTGANFLPGSVVHFNGTPAPTSYVGPASLTAIFSPSTVPQATRPGGIAVNVANAAGAVSNTLVLELGSPPGANGGTIRRQPLAPAPGQSYTALMEGCTPFQIFSLYVDAANVPPVEHFPDLAADQVLAVSPLVSPGPFLPLVEGLGIFGTATPIPLSAQGSFSIPGFVLPNPAINLDLTVQGVYLDPSAVHGFRLTWARWPDRL